jgi:UPF0176 protein
MRVILYYKYVAVPEPAKEVQEQLKLCKDLGLRGRVFIGSEGINGTCSGTPEAIQKYQAYLNAHPLFSGIAFKESDHPEHVFAKMFVRHRPEIVALKTDVSATNAAAYITPEQLHAELEAGEDLVLIDMRNDYEAAIGRFRNAVTLTMRNFRELPEYMTQLEVYKDRNVVTYCTGGIRCERASALLKKHGFTNVRQLEGGIVKYCEAFPDGYYDGSLFVFDSRLSMRFPGKRPHTYLTKCSFCNTPCDRYRDCQDHTCTDRLFICCEACEPKCDTRCRKHAKHVAVAA